MAVTSVAYSPAVSSTSVSSVRSLDSNNGLICGHTPSSTILLVIVFIVDSWYSVKILLVKKFNFCYVRRALAILVLLGQWYWNIFSHSLLLFFTFQIFL